MPARPTHKTQPPGRVPHIRITRISCHTALDKATYAPFRKEGRMKCNNATKFYRKSGAAYVGRRRRGEAPPMPLKSFVYQLKAFEKKIHFRPTYADANAGHPSRGWGLVGGIIDL